MSINENTGSLATPVGIGLPEQSCSKPAVPKQNSRSQRKPAVPPFTVEYAKLPTSIEVENTDATEATPPQVIEDKAPAQAKAVVKKDAGNVQEEIRKLNEEEAKQLAALETTIQEGIQSTAERFQDTALAFYQIKEAKLYSGSHKSLEAYFIERWSVGRAHAYRLIEVGKIINRVSPHGDIKAFGSESHFRPLTSLTETHQDAVIAKIEKWMEITGNRNVTPKMVAAAVVIVTHAPKTLLERKKSKRVEELESCVAALKAKLEVKVVTELKSEFAALEQAIIREAPKTGITWTEGTWNMIHGCSPCSPGCYRCYAARFFGTRFMHRCPGMTEQCKLAGVKVHAFNGAIKCDCDLLGDPLRDRIPKRYFVNAFSDTFHKDVPEEFIEEIFDVMEKADWHVFQLLTKRPGRMAEFVAKRYGDKQAPAHIWFGTTIEDQERLEERLPQLLKINAAVRWLSIEPLLGALNLPSLDGIHWVIVGGESGKNARQMKKEWVTPIRDACEKANIPFFFKQWGGYREDGEKQKTEQEPVTLDGKVYRDYPVVDAHQDGEACAPDECAAPVAVVDNAEAGHQRAA